MSYDAQILLRAKRRFESDRAERRRTLEGRREGVYLRQPRLREIENELRGTSGKILAAALRKGTDPRKALDAIREQNVRLQAEKKALLARLRLPADYLDEKPGCPLCGDRGYVDGKMCRCLLDYCAKEQRTDLSRMLDLGAQSFDSFSLRWYSKRTDPEQGMSPRSNMEDVYETCAEYAARFGPGSGNLLFFGASGLGKTFLSAAIAREVSAAGFSVVYDTAARVFRQFEAERFDRDDAAYSDVSRVLRCDLLILDDLGTELCTAFIKSALYQIVNTRLMERRSTILNTNLQPNELSERYSPQIASRIEGEYEILSFFGDDIRQLKKEYNGQPPF